MQLLTCGLILSQPGLVGPVIVIPMDADGCVPGKRSRVELFVEIRRGSRMEGLSVRALAKKHGAHRRTVRQALMSAVPPETEKRRWCSHKIDPFIDAIDDMLRTDLEAPRKQRRTVTRIMNRLVDERDGAGLVSYSTLCAYVALRRPQIADAAGKSPVAQVLFRNRFSQAERRRLISRDCMWIRRKLGRSATCSRCAWRSRVCQCTGSSRRSRRRLSWKATLGRSMCWEGFRCVTSSTTT